MLVEHGLLHALHVSSAPDAHLDFEVLVLQRVAGDEFEEVVLERARECDEGDGKLL